MSAEPTKPKRWRRYETLAGELREHIVSTCQEGDDLPSEAALASQFGVGVSTLRRALAQLAKEGMIERCHGKLSKVVFRKPKETVAAKIALVLRVAPHRSEHFTDEINHISAHMSDMGWRLQLVTIPIKAMSESWDQVNSMLSGQEYDVIIVNQLVPPNRQELTFLEELGCPFVIMTHSPVDASYIAVDIGAGVYDAACHLRTLGYKDVRFLIDLKEEPWDRLHGARRFLQEYDPGRDPEECIIRTFGDIASGLKTATELFSEVSTSVGVICQNDLCAIGVEMAAREGGLRIPEDVGIVGIDDIQASREAVPPLTTIRQPMAELGRQMVSMICQLNANPNDGKRQVLLMPSLVIRESTVLLPNRGMTEKTLVSTAASGDGRGG